MERKTHSYSSTGLTLRTKMVLLSAAAFAGILLVSAISLFMMNEVRIGGTAYQSIQKNKNALESTAQLKSDLFQINSEMQDFMLEADPITAEKSIVAIKNLTKDIEQNFGTVLESVDSPGKHSTINKAHTIWIEYRKTLLEEVLPAATNGDVLKASYLMTGIQAERFNTFSKAIVQMVERIHLDVAATEEQVAAGIRIKIAISAAVTTIAIGLIALFSYYITTSITRPLRSCVEFAKAMADGKLDARLEVQGGGEASDLAAAMNIMAENLHSIVSRIGSASEVLTSIDNNLENAVLQVVNSAQMQDKSVQETSQAVVQINKSVYEINDGMDKLSESTTETSSSSLEMAATIEEIAMGAEKLEEAAEEVSSSIIEMTSSIKEIGASIINLLDASITTASSIAEMDATIKQVEKNSKDSASISESVRSDAEIGKNAVLEAIAGMQAIRASSQITSEVVETLSLRVNDIGTILQVIDEVAEQTHLLALNAAIIAAQAGEHGKGFAVVADEIRELADRTSSSTQEIATVIKGVQEETRRAVNAINQAEESIAEGEKLSQRSGTALEKIVAGVERAGLQVSEIAKATIEQARGSQSIREAMESVEDMVSSIANSSREHSRGAEMISAAVERMKNLTIHLRTSTREQSRASSMIARSTEDVTLMVDQIREACRLQIDSSALISKSVNDIEGATNANSHATTVMNSAVTDLTQQIYLLEKEMAGFKI
ncbi:MAG: methyl-accepting chemotaxis protein [Desulfuromonadaceae bacterium]|nr:methyl-accepting chemotaxis protein [Desulfuromonadaceae bacterium]